MGVLLLSHDEAPHSANLDLTLRWVIPQLLTQFEGPESEFQLIRLLAFLGMNEFLKTTAWLLLVTSLLQPNAITLSLSFVFSWTLSDNCVGFNLWLVPGSHHKGPHYYYAEEIYLPP